MLHIPLVVVAFVGLAFCLGNGELHQGILLQLQLERDPCIAADALALAICNAHTGGSRLKDFYNL